MEIILTHTNADFDAVASMLAAHKLNPGAIPILPPLQNRNVAQFTTLYRNGLPFVTSQAVRSRSIDRVILVDTQRLPDTPAVAPKTPLHIIDHHPLAGTLSEGQTFSGEVLGATTTLLVEQIQQQSIALTSLEATLLMLGIYEDTGSLTYSTTTPRDILAASWLLKQQAVLESVRRFLSPPLTDEQQLLGDLLLTNAESREIQGHTIVVSAAIVETYIAEISSVAHRLRDTLDPSALFIVVQMPDTIHMVCRGTDAALDVGEIARFFGGGGHTRAAAATLRDRTLDETLSMLWDQIERLVQPSVRVAELMSFGVQTYNPDTPIRDLIHQMRRVGHEGYPVVENGRVIGLLLRRDADRTLEHELEDLTVRDIMLSGVITLTPEASVASLEQLMVESGWGQIPVVDDGGRLIGIVTRTDLINHWAQTHPAAPVTPDTVAPELIEQVLGSPTYTLVRAIVHHAHSTSTSLYMVGGTVRDLLLHRPNDDIDFVTEEDAIVFANSLCRTFGGETSSFRPFGTAKWLLSQEVAASLGIDSGSLPHHIDFSSSRNEFYEHPTALPTVYTGSIKLDLQRRDFTINTIAIQMSPPASMWRILDFYGGMKDLREGLIRALHSLSFVDDPTRILRAVRFEGRLGFQIETRTTELIDTALPMLQRVTGNRLRSELTLLLREEGGEEGLLKLQNRGVLRSIHPAFAVQPNIGEHFDAARSLELPWPMPEPDRTDLLWHIVMSAVPVEPLGDLCQRLMFGRHITRSILDTARLTQTYNGLAEPDIRPSQVVKRLDEVTKLALLVTWLMIDNTLARERIQRYMLDWRHIKTVATGHTLRAMGLRPGPRFRVILERLREARLDGEITSDSEEKQRLQQLVDEEVPDDGA